jgi:hypothetical protein
MNGWLVPIVLYLFGFGVFRILGGVSSAADAFRQWGRHSSRSARKFASS